MIKFVKTIITIYKKYRIRTYPVCKYYPSCSEYMVMSLERHGFWKGLIKSIWRIIRCNPFSKGGIDLP
ncbi:MAG: membrane protein insertion efficiency factor YidD [Candidatus Calescibacterium sp.]|nr:membrane protein insertion efficiency factor YidD [Candidatus Calescibacterium sp.]MCX7758611.1 membrane protein insertion efficiency factor YidD [bacterium]